jgi:hypothetical protein
LWLQNAIVEHNRSPDPAEGSEFPEKATGRLARLQGCQDWLHECRLAVAYQEKRAVSARTDKTISADKAEIEEHLTQARENVVRAEQELHAAKSDSIT